LGACKTLTSLGEIARLAAVLIAAGSGAAWVNRPALPGDQFQLAEGNGSWTRIAEGNGTQTRIAEGNGTVTRIAEGNGTVTRIAEGNGPRTRVA
jgi:hypothetical protein